MRAALLQPSVQPIRPTDLTGLAAHWKADAGTWQDTGLSTPASADSDPVGGWADLTGSAHSATQGTAGSRPLLRTGIFGSRPGILFDGVDDHLIADTVAALVTGSDVPFTFFAVVKPLTAASQRGIASAGASGSTQQTHWCYADGATWVWRQLRRADGDGGGGTVLAPVVQPATTDAQAVIWSFSGTSAANYAGQAQLGAREIDVGTLTLNRWTLGAIRRVTVASYFHGYLGECGLFTRYLYPREAERLAAYLQREWGALSQ